MTIPKWYHNRIFVTLTIWNVEIFLQMLLNALESFIEVIKKFFLNVEHVFKDFTDQNFDNFKSLEIW